MYVLDVVSFAYFLLLNYVRSIAFSLAFFNVYARVAPLWLKYVISLVSRLRSADATQTALVRHSTTRQARLVVLQTFRRRAFSCRNLVRTFLSRFPQQACELSLKTVRLRL